jgi:tRNA (mo5U34)-methyltransferase
LRPNGTCIIESLIIPGDESYCLFPKKRYAKMKNVYFVPTLECLTSWMERIHFSNIRVLDISPLTSEEQRKTPFAPFESLEEFQDGKNPLKTAEGYPWPLRATIAGTKLN